MFQKDIAFLSASALYTSLEVLYTSFLQLWMKKHGAYRFVGGEVYELQPLLPITCSYVSG
jgi:hypothetical protein